MDPNAILHELLSAHGLNVVPYEGWLTADRRPSAMSLAVYRDEAWHPSLIQLDLRAMTPDGRTLVESFTGIGDDRESAIRSGIEAMCQSSLHVLLTTLWDVDPADQVEVVPWETRAGPRQAVIGGIVQRGQALPLPPELFLRVEAALVARADRPLHWLRVFRSCDGPEVTTEVLLDNEPWPELREAVAALPWQPAEGYASMRVFLTLRDPTAMRG